jgi:enoyl-[acyl-carrier protein] reductase II
MKNNIISKKLNIEYPIIQAGMIWVSGAKLAAACSNAGILGTIGAGSMSPELLKAQIIKAKSLTMSPLAVNLPLLYSKIEQQIDISLTEGIKIFITSAGSPKKYTKYLKDQGAIVIHATSTPELAKKCEDAGVDMLIAEGFEAGGHNGRDEITTFALIPQVRQAVDIPIIAAGGIASGDGILAARALGADGVQLGTRFITCHESSAHENFKSAVIAASANDTKLMMKNHVPVRLLKSKFYNQVQELENSCASKEQLIELLGKGRAKAGMHEGNLEIGELEVGQISGLITKNLSARQIVNNLVSEYNDCLNKISGP